MLADQEWGESELINTIGLWKGRFCEIGLFLDTPNNDEALCLYNCPGYGFSGPWFAFHNRIGGVWYCMIVLDVMVSQRRGIESWGANAL